MSLNNSLEDLLEHFDRDNHQWTVWAREQGIGHEGYTDHVKRMMLASLVISNATTLDTLIYETGFNTGASAAALAEAIEITGGKLVCFEIDELKKPIADKFLERFPETQFVWGDSGETILPRLAQDAGKVTLFHQDGSHGEEDTSQEISNALVLLKPGGILVVDDSNDPTTARAIRCIIPNEGLWLTHQTGQFIYQKR